MLARGATAVGTSDDGVPTLVRAVRRIAAAPGTTPEAAARAHLAYLAPGYGVRAMPSLEAPADLVLEGGGHLFTFAQSIDGILVDGGRMSVLVRADGSLVAVGGQLVDRGARTRAAFAITAEHALEVALGAHFGVETHPVVSPRPTTSTWSRVVVPAVAGFYVERGRARRVLTARDARLEPAFEVEVFAGSPSASSTDAFRFLVHAADGTLLATRDLTQSDSYTYRVHADAQRAPTAGPIADYFPHPTGTPDGAFPSFVPPMLVSVETIKVRPAGMIDPWLPAGATTTNGNNIDAYTDRAAPDGLSGTDFRASVTSPGTFDRVFDTALSPVASTAQQSAAITQLFYTTNHLHDYWYDSGFDEAHANAQAQNFGRGGVEGDVMRVEAQDAYDEGSRDNANMSTPADGESPRMQMYVWGDSNPGADSALDALVVQHEWGHYLHHRLSQCGTAQCAALSEGWADFVALHAQLRENDALDGTYGAGVYSAGAIAYANAGYYGIRRVPYSRDLTKNALSFRHIANGQALPAAHPVANVGDPANAEEHNAGEVWTTALFDAYLSVVENHPFATAKRRFADYVVAGLLLTPTDATFTQTRDALLIAAGAIDPADGADMASAFARRGMGTCAVSPAQSSTTFTDLTESTSLASAVSIASVTLVPSGTLCDADAYLDAGESALVTVTLTNAGGGASTTTVTLTADDAALTASAPTKSITVPAFTSATTTFDVTLAAMPTTLGTNAITVTTMTPGACSPTESARHAFRVNADETVATSASTTFVTRASEFTAAGENAADIWALVPGEMFEGAMQGTDYSSPSDTAIVSPPLVVSASTPFVVTFTHTHDFEFGDGVWWDGGVVEFTTDDGATWADVATLSAPGYNATLGDPDMMAMNVLRDRPGYGATNAAHPASNTVTLSFGNALAGQTVRLRFRIGTDDATGGPGWTIHDFAATGITNTPFGALVVDDGVCMIPDAGVPVDGNVAPGDDAGMTEPPANGGRCSVGTTRSDRASPMGLSFVVVALVLSRRRRTVRGARER
jgi:hypothetical protein